MSKFEIYIGLMQLAENGFKYKLQKNQPDLTEAQIKKEVNDWYLDHSVMNSVDFVKADISRFK